MRGAPTRFAAIIGAFLCWAAGLYLLNSQALGSNSYLELIAHGIGIYFLGKGFFVGASVWEQARSRSTLEQLLELQAYEHQQRLGRAKEPVA